MKDWMQLAANEIASHWTFGGGRDSYVTDEQRWNVANNFRVIIEKHAPRCDTCKHWDRFELEDKGICHLAGMAILFAADELETREEFGCVSWEAK